MSHSIAVFFDADIDGIDELATYLADLTGETLVPLTDRARPSYAFVLDGVGAEVSTHDYSTDGALNFPVYRYDVDIMYRGGSAELEKSPPMRFAQRLFSALKAREHPLLLTINVEHELDRFTP